MTLPAVSTPPVEVEGEPIVRVTWQYGVARLKPIGHFLTWLDHDTFEVRSEIMTVTAPADDLGLVVAYMRPITFVNERPERPTVWHRLTRALRSKGEV